MTIDMLSPEEKKMLLEALQGGGDNQAEEDEKFESLAQAVQLLQAQYDALDEKVDCVVKLLQDEIVGPIAEEYEAGRRANGIKGLSEKYGDKFGEYGDFYKGLTGSELFEKLFDELEERKAGADQWTEESESGAIEELLNGLKAKKDAVAGALSPKEETKEEPKGSAVVVEKVTAEPESKGESIEDYVRKLKARGIPGMGK